MDKPLHPHIRLLPRIYATPNMYHVAHKSTVRKFPQVEVSQDTCFMWSRLQPFKMPFYLLPVLKHSKSSQEYSMGSNNATGVNFVFRSMGINSKWKNSKLYQNLKNEYVVKIHNKSQILLIHNFMNLNM